MREGICQGLRGLASGYDALRIGLAVLLLASAGLKGLQLGTEPDLGVSLLESRWFLVVVVELELLFALWLVGNMYPLETRWLAIACFAAFALVSCYKGLAGASSCGCFGRLQVNPWVTLIVDVAAVFSLLRFAPRLSADTSTRNGYLDRWSTRRRMTATLVLWCLLGVPAALAMANPGVRTLGEDGLIALDAKTVVLEPEKWINKPFPLASHVDIGEKLVLGQWLVVLYHQGCPRCEYLLERSTELAARLQVVGMQLAFLDVDASATGVTDDIPRSLIRGELSDTRRWFVETPKLIGLNNGVVERVSAESDFWTDGLETLSMGGIQRW